MDVEAARPLLQHIWLWVVQHWGPHTKPTSWQLHSTPEAQAATRELYYKLHEEDEFGGWGTACKAALGKMEYHLPSCAALTSLAEQALRPDAHCNVMSDCSVKCGIRHYDMRVVHGCAVIDSEVRRLPSATQGRTGVTPMQTPLRTTVLTKCMKDPIKLSEMWLS